MHTKLAVVLLSGLSVGLSLSALAVADGEPVGYMDWSYVMGSETSSADSKTPSKPETNFIKTPSSLAMESKIKIDEKTETTVAETIPVDTGLTLSYVDEAAPIMPVEEIEGPVKKKKCAYQKCKGTVLSDPISVRELHPQVVANKTIVENKIDTKYVQQPVKVQYPITRQYPISVQYPVTVQRDVTIEQPVVMQQPVIVRRPVVMQQAVTVQRPTTYIQQQPMVMQQQPTYIQQQPVVMHTPQQNVVATAPVSISAQVQTQTMSTMTPITLPGQAISVSQPDVVSLTTQIPTVSHPQMMPSQPIVQPVMGSPVPTMQVTSQQPLPVSVQVPQQMPVTVPTAGQVMPQTVQPVVQGMAQPSIGNTSQAVIPMGYSYPVY